MHTVNSALSLGNTGGGQGQEGVLLVAALAPFGENTLASAADFPVLVVVVVVGLHIAVCPEQHKQVYHRHHHPHNSY